jgi:glycosyltransferase involved in cell wall biosynthesis
MDDATRYFYDERYRGLSLVARLPGGLREALIETLDDLRARNDHPRSSWDEYSQELLLWADADMRDAYLSRRVRFPFFRIADEEQFWRCLRDQSPFIERLAREYPHLGVERLEQLWLERGRGMPLAVPSPVDKLAKWRSTDGMSPGSLALAADQGPYAAVIVTPRCGIGGSEKVMREMMASIERLTGLPSLMIVADTEVAPEHLPAGAICLANLAFQGEPFLRSRTPDRVAALRDVIVQVDAPRVITLNSFAGNTLLLDGTLQDKGIKTASAVFFEAVGAGGAIGGYIQIADWLIDAGVTLFTDNDHIARLMTATSFYEDTVVLLAPETVSETPPPQGSRVLWAGRIDQQKRPDLLVDIARASPDLTYEVWGVPLLSGAAALDDIMKQPNIVFRGAFDGFESIDTSDAGCLLYTSAYDGTPNLLLEAMARGLACVSTAVGGIPDLLAEGRGVLIGAEAPAGSYVEALRGVLTDRDARASLVERSLAYIRKERTQQIFDQTVANLLSML